MGSMGGGGGGGGGPAGRCVLEYLSIGGISYFACSAGISLLLCRSLGLCDCRLGSSSSLNAMVNSLSEFCSSLNPSFRAYEVAGLPDKCSGGP